MSNYQFKNFQLKKKEIIRFEFLFISKNFDKKDLVFNKLIVNNKKSFNDFFYKIFYII